MSTLWILYFCTAMGCEPVPLLAGFVHPDVCRMVKAKVAADNPEKMAIGVLTCVRRDEV